MTKARWTSLTVLASLFSASVAHAYKAAQIKTTDAQVKETAAVGSLTKTLLLKGAMVNTSDQSTNGYYLVRDSAGGYGWVREQDLIFLPAQNNGNRSPASAPSAKPNTASLETEQLHHEDEQILQSVGNRLARERLQSALSCISNSSEDNLTIGCANDFYELYCHPYPESTDEPNACQYLKKRETEKQQANIRAYQARVEQAKLAKQAAAEAQRIQRDAEQEQQKSQAALDKANRERAEADQKRLKEAQDRKQTLRETLIAKALRSPKCKAGRKKGLSCGDNAQIVSGIAAQTGDSPDWIAMLLRDHESDSPERSVTVHTPSKHTDSEIEQKMRETKCWRSYAPGPYGGSCGPFLIIAQIDAKIYEIAPVVDCDATTDNGENFSEHIIMAPVYGEHMLLHTTTTTFKSKGALPHDFYMRWTGQKTLRGQDGFTHKFGILRESPECALIAKGEFQAAKKLLMRTRGHR